MSIVNNKPQHGDVLVDDSRRAATPPFQEFLDSLTRTVNANVGDIEFLKELIDVAIEDYWITSQTRLDAGSEVTQNPVGLDTPAQIAFGPGQVNEGMVLEADGTVNFTKTAYYTARLRFNVGRVNSNGEAILFIRALVNGQQLGNPVAAVIDSSRIVVPLTFTRTVGADPGDVLTFEMYRDSTGVDDGGLFIQPATITSWGSATSTGIILEESLIEKKADTNPIAAHRSPLWQQIF